MKACVKILFCVMMIDFFLTGINIFSQPVLHPINNSDGDHSYRVSWDSFPGATIYALVVKDTNSVRPSTYIYYGPQLSKQFNFQRKGTYSYQLYTRNDTSSLDTSNVEYVTVQEDPVNYLKVWAAPSFGYDAFLSVEVNGEIESDLSYIMGSYLYWSDGRGWVKHINMEKRYQNSGNTYKGTVEHWMIFRAELGGICLRAMFEFTGGYFSNDTAQACYFYYPQEPHVESSFDVLSTHFKLYQNYPNPFSSRTVISYQLPAISDVELSVYNLLGQKVATLVKERQQPGIHRVEWDAEGMKPSIYWCELKTGQSRQVIKMILLRK